MCFEVNWCASMNGIEDKDVFEEIHTKPSNQKCVKYVFEDAIHQERSHIFVVFSHLYLFTSFLFCISRIELIQMLSSVDSYHISMIRAW